MLATDDDGQDNEISYNITYDTPVSGSGSGALTGELEIFTFSINSDGEISNDDIFPEITEDEEVCIGQWSPSLRTPL